MMSHVQLPSTAREGKLSYSREKEVGGGGGYCKKGVYTFSLAGLFPGKRGVLLLPVGLCYLCRA